MISLQLDNVSSVLCLGAHADDIEIGCGGTILKLLEEHEGLSVYWVVLSGAGNREIEARKSAEMFLSNAGTKTICVEAFPDAFFPYNGQEIKEYFNELRRVVSPDIVFTHRLEDRHQDHRLVSELTWNTFRDHLIVEYEIPKYEGDLGMANLYSPLSEATCQKKIDIVVDTFESQKEKRWFNAEAFLALLRVRGIEAGSESPLAEGFYCRKLTI